MNHRPWINFKVLRGKLKFDAVLARYKVEVRRRGNQHQGPCPLPGHTGSKTAYTFSANLERGIFQCFGCGAKGNVLEFAGLMEGVNVEDGSALRRVAVDLQTTFFPEGASTKTQRNEEKSKPPLNLSPATAVNEPLDFALKDLDPAHPGLLALGFMRETLGHFGVGFCSRGMLKDKVAIPLHNGSGALVGYAGMTLGKGGAGTQSFAFPEKRERMGRLLDFDTALLLYNAHRIEKGADELYVVEWFPTVWRAFQHGLPHAVALMGPTCSQAQANIICDLVAPAGRIWVMSEATPTAPAFAKSALAELSPHRFTRWVKLGEKGLLSDGATGAGH